MCSGIHRENRGGQESRLLPAPGLGAAQEASRYLRKHRATQNRFSPEQVQSSARRGSSSGGGSSSSSGSSTHKGHCMRCQSTQLTRFAACQAPSLACHPTHLHAPPRVVGEVLEVGCA